MYKALKKTILYTVTLILLLILAGTVCYADSPPQSNEIIDGVPIYVNDELVSDTAMLYQGNIYLNIATVQKYGQAGFITFDTSVNKALFDVSDLDIFVADAETTNYLKANAGEMMLPIKYIGSPKKTNNISLGSISQLCKLDYRYENGKVYLYPYTGSEPDAPVSHKYNIYYEAREKDTFDTAINLVWQMVADPGYKTSDGRKIVWGDCDIPPEKSDNIDVMSPMWMRTETWGEGFIENNNDFGYVELAHNNGMKVWICATNYFTSNNDEVMKNESYRKRAVAQLILCTILCKADGINIDFESMNLNTIKTAYTEFVIELNKYTSRTGLTLSLATMLASDYWCLYFDFKTLGENSDYICPMTYNEHWTLSVGPGSTMSKSYYTKNTDNLIKYVPAEKILMGVPLFTQVWEVWPSGSPRFLWTVAAWRQLELIEARGVTPVWFEEDGQYIASYPGNDYPSDTIKIWVEDERSMANKLAYVMDRGLAGTACWAMGQQYDGMMDVFGKVYKQGVDPLSIPGYYYDPNFTAPAAEEPGPGTQTGQDNEVPEAPQYKKGDFNGDDAVDSNDLTDLSRYIAMIIDVDNEALISSCDLDHSGTVDSNDLTLLSRFVAMIIDDFE